MYKPGERPSDLTKAQTSEDNVPAEGQKGVEVPKMDEDGNPIDAPTSNSTQVQTSTSSNSTAANATLAVANSSSSNVSVSSNATNSTTVAAA